MNTTNKRMRGRPARIPELEQKVAEVTAQCKEYSRMAAEHLETVKKLEKQAATLTAENVALQKKVHQLETRKQGDKEDHLEALWYISDMLKEISVSLNRIQENTTPVTPECCSSFEVGEPQVMPEAIHDISGQPGEPTLFTRIKNALS